MSISTLAFLGCGRRIRRRVEEKEEGGRRRRRKKKKKTLSVFTSS